MAYTPNTTERAFLEDFYRNLPAIQAFRAQYPKEDLEGAYFKVTGKKWPEGRSVKQSGNGYEMTKDRTVKSVLGKYIAPIGAGIATGLTLGGAAPLFGGLFGGGSAAGAGAGTIGTIGGTALNLGAGTGAAAAAAGGGIGWGSVLGAIASPTIGTIGNVYANRAASGAARDAAEFQSQSANYAADLQAKSAEEQLAFLREQEAQRRKEFDETQARNFGIYQDERDYDRGIYAQRQARLAPYRDLGAGSIGQLARPIQNIPQAGSIAAVARRR